MSLSTFPASLYVCVNCFTSACFSKEGQYKADFCLDTDPRKSINPNRTGPSNCTQATGLLEISPVERGVVTLLGVRSGLFIAMSDKGKLYGSGHYNDECKFKENLLTNNYNAYESAAYPGMYIGLSKTGKTKRGNRVTLTMTMTHFLPRI